MLTVWEYSSETEALRVIHCAHSIINNFFRLKNFYVLPYGHPLTKPSTVSFPDLNYQSISRFWEKVKLADVLKLPIKYDTEFVSKVEKLSLKANLDEPDMENTKAIWKQAQDEVMKTIYKVIPGAPTLNKLIIMPTKIGTRCSFSWLDDNHDTIIMYLRGDNDIYGITESILTVLTRRDIFNNLDANWEESEMLVDWLLTYSSIATVLKKYQKPDNFVPTLKGIRSVQNAKILEASDEFYKKLGLPVNQKVFSLNGKTPEIYKKPLLDLSAKEKIILRTLIEKSENVVGFDEIADMVFAQEEDYSLYAIAKTIQRLRDKLERNGISGSYIQTLRGKGYILKN